MPLNAGDVRASVGFDLDSREARQFEDELRKLRADAARGAEAKLRLDVDEQGFAHGRRRINELRNDADMAVPSIGRLATSVRGLVDIAGKITAAGIGAQAVSALGGAAVSTATALGPLSGLLAAYPALGSAAAQATGVFTLATKDLAEAIAAGQEAQKGGREEAKAYREELKLLSDEQAKFVVQLVNMGLLQQRLGAAASAGLGEAAEGLSLAAQNFEPLEQGIASTSEVLGDLAKQAGELLGSRGFGRDLETQMARNDTTIRRTGEGALNLANAVRDVVIESGPLVNFLTLGSLRLTEFIEAEVRAGRESGELREFFGETREVLEDVVPLLTDFSVGVINLGREGYPTGRLLLRDLRDAAAEFREWSESAGGRNTVREWFEDSVEPARELGNLIVDATQAAARLGNGEQVAPLLRMIRRELLPAIEELVDETTESFGPVFIDLLREIILLFTQLAGDSGPLHTFVVVLADILGMFNTLLEKVPGLQEVVVTLAAAGGIAKALGIAGAVTGVNQLIRLLRVARTEAAVTNVATAGAGAGAAGAGSRAGRTLRSAGESLPLVGTAALGILAFSEFSSARTEAAQAREVAAAMRELERSIPDPKRWRDNEAAIRRLTGELASNTGEYTAARRGLRNLGLDLDAHPDIVARVRKAYGELRERFEATQELMRHGIPLDADVTAQGAKDIAQALTRMKNSTGDTIREVRTNMRLNMRLIRQNMDEESDAGRAAVGANFRAAAAAIKRGVDSGKIATRDGMREVRRLLSAELELYGFTPAQARRELSGRRFDGGRQEGLPRGLPGEGPEAGGNPGRARGGRYARGGWIGAPGMVGQDTVQIAPGVWAAHGEWHGTRPGGGGAVVNRHQAPFAEMALAITRALGGNYGSLSELGTAPVDQPAYLDAAMRTAFGGVGLDTLFSAVNRPHYLARGGIVPVPGFPGESAAASILDEIAAVTRTFGLRLTDAFGPGHQSPGHTVTGTAADFAGPDRAMDAAVRALVARGYLVGYDGRFGSQAWPGHGPSYVAGRNAHLHVEFGGGAGGFAAPVTEIAAPVITGGGTVGRIAQGAVRMATAGANKLLRGAASAALAIPTGGGGTGGGAGASEAQARAWVAAGLRLAGQPPTPGSVATVLGRAWQESRWNPRAINNWDINAQRGDPSRGFLQTIMATFRRFAVPGHGNVWNPVDNTAAAVRYMMSTYGRLVGAGPGGYAAGGFFNRGGGYGPNVSSTREGSLNPYDAIRALRRRQGDRIEDYEQIMGNLEHAQNVYTRMDRRFGLSEETLIDPDTGAVNQGEVNKRVGELTQLWTMRIAMVDYIKQALRVARRVVASYQAIIGRLERSLKWAPRKERGGIRASIKHYREQLGEWQGKIEALGWDLQDAEIDRDQIRMEQAEVKGTQPDLRDPGTPDVPDAAGVAQPDVDQVARADQAVAEANRLRLDLAAARGNLAAFGGAGDLGVGGVNAIAAATGGVFGTGGSQAGGLASYGGMVNPAALAAGGGGLAGLFPGGVPAGGVVIIAPQIASFVPPTGADVVRMSRAVVESLDAAPTRPATVERVGG